MAQQQYTTKRRKGQHFTLIESGNIKETLKLLERIYHCECCGLEIDRDYNTSINILRKGLEISKEEKVS